MRSRAMAAGEAFDRADAAFDRRFASRPSAVVLVELFLAIGWLRAAVAKSTTGAWWSGREIREFLVDHDTQTISWYRP